MAFQDVTTEDIIELVGKGCTTTWLVAYELCGHRTPTSNEHRTVRNRMESLYRYGFLTRDVGTDPRRPGTNRYRSFVYAVA